MIENNYSISSSLSLTIAHISDLHNREGSRVIESLKRKQPDIIAITGDIVLRRKPRGDNLIVESERNILPFLSACARIAPTYMSLGNHEIMLCEKDFERIRRTGVKVLDNTWVEKDEYVIGGLTSAYVLKYRELRVPGDGRRYPIWPPIVNPVMEERDYAWLDEFVKVPKFKILLSHHPEYWSLREPKLTGRDIDLVLSGHAHGGQFRFFSRGVFAPGQGWFPEYTSGIHWGENGRMIISRGLANTAKMVPRLFNPTEVVYVELMRGEAEPGNGVAGIL